MATHPNITPRRPEPRRVAARLARRAMAAIAALFIAVPSFVDPALAIIDKDDPLADRITADVLAEAFPGATEIGDISGDPPLAPVLIDGELAGYLLSTFDTDPIGGFTGVPFDLVVGLDLDGHIMGVSLIEHHEPIIGHGSISEDKLIGFFDHLSGFRVDGSLKILRQAVDGITGATVSAELMRSAIVSTARQIAKQEGIIAAAEAGIAVDIDGFEPRDWDTLIATGAVTHLPITYGDLGGDTDRPANTPFLDVYAALATPGGIGRNFFGGSWHAVHLTGLEVDEHLLVIGSIGDHRLFGITPLTEGAYDSIRIVQGDKIFPLSHDNKLGKPSIIPRGAPFFNERAMFRLGAKDGFDALAPWSLDFEIAAGNAEPVSFSLPYKLPVDFVSGSDFALEEAGYFEPTYVFFGLLRESRLSDWQRVWAERAGDIALLGLLLATLTLILLFQDRITANRRLHLATRIGFLTIVLLWLGWTKNAQLTSLNIITYVQTALSGLDATLVLLDPLIFLLSVYVLVTLFLWGRGVFCGWLCPFGALQELSNRLARLLRVPQITIPTALNEKLWALKYVIAVVIFATATWSIDAAITVAEVEPFKTAIVVGFERDWPYLLYAGLLLLIGLFVERFFCRFLCPLGATLSLFGRLPMLHWLRRRPECGNPCTICRHSCPVDAIRPDGVINMNECFQCLDCQVEYFDDTACPPLVAERKRAEKAVAAV